MRFCSYLFTRPEKSAPRESFVSYQKTDKARGPPSPQALDNYRTRCYIVPIWSTRHVVELQTMLHPRTGRQLKVHETRAKEHTPRVKLATRLYATGVAKTKAAAAEMAGLAPSTYYLISTTESKVSDLMNHIDKELESEQLDTGRLLKHLGRKAIRHIAWTLDSDEVKHDTRLKAAQDLADRSPETSKTTNLNVGLGAGLSQEQVQA